MLDHFGVTADSWRDAIAQDPHFAFSETPRFLGRAVAALAADREIMAKSGGRFASWDLAHEYGFDDVDGTRPDWGAHARDAGLMADSVARPRTVSDDAVLDATARAVGRVGPARLTLGHVAAEVGLAPATLVQRFAPSAGCCSRSRAGAPSSAAPGRRGSRR